MALIAVAATARSAGRHRDDPQRPRRDHRNSGSHPSCDGRRANYPSMLTETGLILASGIEITFFDIIALSKVAGF
jgi:hypothetical protein